MKEQTESPFNTIIQNYAYHDFNERAIFVGIYQKTVELKEAGKDEKGKDTEPINAHVFYDLESGEGVYISTAYSINKAIEKAKKDFESEMVNENMVFNIEFLGKTEVKGKPFNQFNIGICTLQQYESFNSPNKVKAEK